MELEEYLAKTPKKYLIFDFDETLFHLLLPWKLFKARLKQILRKLDSNLDFGQGIIALANQAVAKHGQKAKKIIYPWAEAFEREYLKGAPMNSQLISFLKKNKASFDYYIWSSNMRRTITSILKKHNLDSLFKKIISRDRVNLTKPHADGFFQIFDPKIHKRADFLMVGDSQNDKKAAKNAGIDYFKLKFRVKNKKCL